MINLLWKLVCGTAHKKTLMKSCKNELLPASMTNKFLFQSILKGWSVNTFTDQLRLVKIHLVSLVGSLSQFKLLKLLMDSKEISILTE